MGKSSAWSTNESSLGATPSSQLGSRSRTSWHFPLRTQEAVIALSSDSAKTPNEGDFLLTPLGIHVLGHVEIAGPPGAGNPDPSLDSLVHSVLHVVEILSNRVVSKEMRLENGKRMLASKNWNQYALVPVKNGFPSIAKFWCRHSALGSNPRAERSRAQLSPTSRPLQWILGPFPPWKGQWEVSAPCGVVWMMN